ncbi:hypothetical protein AAMO2058_001242400 [Amorphochlora amoebiformis]|uniref:Cytochrome P450 n=1 Tax=Amorphochlora amoebiformis TaxID=1561963 RepID=A0A7S0DDK3_9EUKA|mmetsp:Transcript_23010/g.36158  ORF Transcript_23010/g.36158 Transcript_23010/m.36158 type:complete len:461 (+) Transcript_23010:51-1433(+)
MFIGVLLIFSAISAAILAVRWYQLDQRLTSCGIPTMWLNPKHIITGDFPAILDSVTAFLDKNNGIGALRSPAGKPFVIVNSPELLRKVLTGVPQKKMHANGVQNPLVGAFSPKLLKLERKVSSAIDSTSILLLKTLTDLFDNFCERETRAPPGSDSAASLRSFWWQVRLCLLFGKNTWNKTTISHCENRFYAEVGQFASLLINMFPAAKYLPLPSTIWYRYSVYKLREHLREEIIQFEANGRDGGKKYGPWAMLNEIDNKETMDLKIDLCMKMLFVGIGPLTDIICWMLYHIAGDQKLQGRLVEEIKTKNSKDFRSVSTLPLMDATYKETLRMYSPVHVGRVTQVEQVLNSYKIPKGCDFMTNMHFIHRSPKYFKDPGDFDPSRFLKHLDSSKPFFPFSIGARSCPGSQISACVAKLFLSRLLSSYRLELDPKPQSAIKTGFNLVMPIRPQNLFLKIRHR